jgi:hypothetical protein
MIAVVFIMAIVTTLMTSPIFDRIYKKWSIEQPVPQAFEPAAIASTTLE